MKDKLMKDNLLKAINDIDFDNVCGNQIKTLEKALVMLQTKWKNNEAVNLAEGRCMRRYPAWNWNNIKYFIIEPKKTVPLDFSDAEKLLGAKIIDTRGGDMHVITNVCKGYVLCGHVTYLYKDLYELCTFVDGSPISKEAEV